MAKNTVNVKQLLEKMRANAQTGMTSGTWFSPMTENVGVELFGTVTRIFEYEYDNETRLAAEMRVLSDVEFTVVKGGDVETVSVAEGGLVLIGLSGQLRYLFERHNVRPGTIAYLKYEGKDMGRKIRGNHPHTWTYNFVNPEADDDK